MSDWRGKLLTDHRGKVVKTGLTNITIMLQHHPDMAGVFGKRGDRRMVLRRPPWDSGHVDWEPRELLHTDHLEVRMWLQTQGLTPYKNQTISAVRHLCEENSE